MGDVFNTFVGTPVYMAPEVLRHEPYNTKSDIWSLGALLYELCQRERLFTPSSAASLKQKVPLPPARSGLRRHPSCAPPSLPCLPPADESLCQTSSSASCTPRPFRHLPPARVMP